MTKFYTGCQSTRIIFLYLGFGLAMQKYINGLQRGILNIQQRNFSNIQNSSFVVLN